MQTILITVVETPSYLAAAKGLLLEAERREVVDLVAFAAALAAVERSFNRWCGNDAARAAPLFQ